MTYQNILTDWGKKIFKPVYWFEGEEGYFIDRLIDYAEHQILSENESAFNLSVFYGKDSTWPELINTCRRYPMFAERQVVLLKEAQHMRDIEKLESYVENPLLSTVLVVAYKDKKVDGRTKFAKLLKDKGVLFQSKKIWDKDLPVWIEQVVKSHGLGIGAKAVALLEEHIGNDLSRISNEITKISVNLGKRKTITEDDIAESTGISKEYNVFELQNRLASRDLYGCMQIIRYFELNPKVAPIQLVLPSLYSFFSKVYMLHSLRGSDNTAAATAIGVRSFLFRDYQKAVAKYSFPDTEKAILLLNQYNLRSVGINDPGNTDAALLREMILKIISQN